MANEPSVIHPVVKALEEAIQTIRDRTFSVDNLIDAIPLARELVQASEEMRQLLREASVVMHRWDGGLDGEDGEDYQIAVEAWEELLPRIDAYLKQRME